MNISEILMSCIWSGLFSAGMGILLTAPMRQVIPAFLCGFAGRFVRDILMSSGLSQNWSTAAAAAVIVLTAMVIIKKHEVSPVVLITGVLPLGAAVAMFNVILELMRLSSVSGEGLSASSDVLIANFAKVLTISLAIALGLAAGMAIVRVIRRISGRDSTELLDISSAE